MSKVFFTGKDKKRVVATSPVKFEPIAEMNSEFLVFQEALRLQLH